MALLSCFFFAPSHRIHPFLLNPPSPCFPEQDPIQILIRRLIQALYGGNQGNALGGEVDFDPMKTRFPSRALSHPFLFRRVPLVK